VLDYSCFSIIRAPPPDIYPDNREYTVLLHCQKIVAFVE